MDRNISEPGMWIYIQYFSLKYLKKWQSSAISFKIYFRIYKYRLTNLSMGNMLMKANTPLHHPLVLVVASLFFIMEYRLCQHRSWSGPGCQGVACTWFHYKQATEKFGWVSTMMWCNSYDMYDNIYCYMSLVKLLLPFHPVCDLHKVGF